MGCNESRDETQLLTESFNRAEWELTGPLATHKINLQYSGTTINMIMIRENFLYCGNVGDSRAVLASLRSQEKKI
jgi:serine/threonine protein phosphatase PrpC